MFGSRRASLLDRSWALGSRAARWAGALIHAVSGQSRWRPTDLYAAAVTARFAASHRLIEQAADAVDDGWTVDHIATSRLLGDALVFEEDQ
ncbi:hypothetical protein FE633_12605 [Streptomyces montanus]|uniref:Uncharacterized protein n=1 Tax=Streptomyces montanus TaxID=2580423 RepID=A0A5R9FVN4_9ACTN|nr:hypothetical protein [Streptomyces montanus]TLS45980.1 hypothetical protein FE633_12605 [Streptomyces montanus]